MDLYWSVVENKRLDDGLVVQRHVLYLGEINSSQAGAWRKAVEVFDRRAAPGRSPCSQRIAARPRRTTPPWCGCACRNFACIVHVNRASVGWPLVAGPATRPVLGRTPARAHSPAPAQHVGDQRKVGGAFDRHRRGKWFELTVPADSLCLSIAPARASSSMPLARWPRPTPLMRRCSPSARHRSPRRMPNRRSQSDRKENCLAGLQAR